MYINYLLPYTQNLIPEEHSIFIEVIKRLNKQGINYTVIGGTLLGLVRDGHPVDTDTDYDIALLNVEPETIKELFADFPLAVEAGTDKVQQLVYCPSGITIDFHFYRLISTNSSANKYPTKYQCFHQYGRIYLELEGLEEKMFSCLEDEPVKCPKNVLSYLDAKYGEGKSGSEAMWRTPLKQRKGKYSRKAITFGCFDPFHFGHLNLIRQAQKFCDELTVIVRTDQHIRKYKNREPVFDEQTRLDQLKTFGNAVLSENEEYDYWINKLNPDIVFVEEGFQYQLSCITISLPRTPNISSSLIRESMGFKSTH